MQELRLSLAFGEADVDAFKQSVSHEQFEEWLAFIQLEPSGWEAIRIATQRLSFIVAQSSTPKKLKERDYELKIRAGQQSLEVEKARFEAMSIRTQIESENHG